MEITYKILKNGVHYIETQAARLEALVEYHVPGMLVIFILVT